MSWIIGFRKKEKEKDFYEEQIDYLKDRINREHYGSDDYEKDMEYLEYLQEQNRLVKNDRKKFDWKTFGTVTIAGIGVLANTLLTIRGQNLTKATAELAYTKDEDMMLCNNKLWNLRKDYPTKVDSSKTNII